MSEQGRKGGAGGDMGPVARFFLGRTTFALLLLMLIVGAGLLAYFSLVKENYPDLAIPQALVSTEWPGADPASVERDVTEELERQIKGLKGLKRLRSASVAQYSLIAVEFRVEAGMEEAMRLLRQAVEKARAHLPPAAKRPVITRMSVNLTPILSINLYGELEPHLMAQAARRLKDRLERVTGVRKVELSGHRDSVVLVQLRPHRLWALGLSPEQVVESIRSNHRDFPLGGIKGAGLGLQFRLLARFRSARELRRLPVARLGGRVVTLGEVALVHRDLARLREITRLSYQGEPFRPTVTLDVLRAPGANTLEVIQELKQVLNRFRRGADWLPGLQAAVTGDESRPIRQSLSSVFNNAWQAMLMVFAVLLLALGWREALVAGLAVPVTFLGSLALLPVLGYTLNQMVVVGMVLALGLLVDNFILVMEGMHEHMAQGADPVSAARATFKQYSLAALAGTLTTILAMLPLAFIGGVDGKFVRLVPVTAAICLLVSYLVAMLLALPLARYPMRGFKPAPTWMDRLSQRYGERFQSWLQRRVLGSRPRSWLWVGGMSCLLVLAVLAAGRLKVIMYPQTDSPPLGITVELAPETPLEQADRVARALGEILRSKEYLESVVAFTGKKSPMAKTALGDELTPSRDSFLVGFSATFRPRDQRPRLSFTYLPGLRAELEKALAAIDPSGVLTFTYAGTGPTSEDPVQIVLSGRSLHRLRAYAERVKTWLAAVPGAVDVRDNLGRPRTDLVLLPRRQALAFHGLSVQDLGRQLYQALEGVEVGSLPGRPGESRVKIRVSYHWPGRGSAPGGPTSLSELETLVIQTPRGAAVPLLSLVDLEVGEVPLAITHEAARRTVVVSCKLAGRTAEEVNRDISARLRQSPPPGGMSWHLAGEARSSQEAYGSAGRMFAVAVALVFAVLVLQTGSFAQPLVILLSLPMAFIGVVAAFLLTGTPFSFPAMIGLISLAGIAVNDAIVLVDTTNRLRVRGLPLVEAAALGSSLRLRPVIVTSVTTMAGLVPLMLSDPMWRPLCLSIIGGVATATVITLVVVPALYVLLLRGSRVSA